MQKTLLLVFVLVLASAVAVGCGSSKKKKKKSGTTAPVSVVIEQTGSKKDAKLKAPASVKAGLATVTLKNSSQADGNAQLVRVEGNHSTEEALKAGNSWGEKGTPLPDWIKLEGGIGMVRPGQTQAVTQSLPAGKYVALNIDSGSYADMKVTGSGSGSAPSEAASIDAVDYSFTATGLEQGKQKVMFENKGKQPHFVVAAPINPGKTIEDAKKAAQEEESSGPPPFDEKSSFSTAIIEGGSKQVVDVDFKKPGKWVALCFIPDRQGGPPHVAKGMVSEITVK
jgi:hypothetical protein